MIWTILLVVIIVWTALIVIATMTVLWTNWLNRGRWR